MFKEKVNGRTDARTDGRTTDNGPWHKLAGLRPVELKKETLSVTETMEKYTLLNFHCTK